MTSSADVDATAAPGATSARMKRMLQTIKKALDVSVSGASSVNLRTFFEDECKDEPELLAQLFASSASPSASTVDDQEHVAGELSAQALQTLRQQIESAFHALCARHQINDQLLMLEETIDAAQKHKIQEQATKDLAEAQQKEQVASSTADGTRSAPEDLVRAERIRVMEAEKKQLELLIRQMQMKKEEHQTRLDIKREVATNAIEDLQHVTLTLHEATAFATDYTH